MPKPSHSGAPAPAAPIIIGGDIQPSPAAPVTYRLLAGNGEMEKKIKTLVSDLRFGVGNGALAY